MMKVKGSPHKILLFSGKRKSGKDYITDRLFQLLDPKTVALIRLSGPIKSHWAKTLNLDGNELLSSSEYKERYRSEMVEWSEGVRKSDHGYFCRAAIEMYEATSKPFWIVSDARRTTDVRWFEENYPSKVKTVRIVCNDRVRNERGWKFTEGIDDKETECGLDDFPSWHRIIHNEGQDLTDILDQLASELRS